MIMKYDTSLVFSNTTAANRRFHTTVINTSNMKCTRANREQYDKIQTNNNF